MLQEAVISSPNPRSHADVGADLRSYLDVRVLFERFLLNFTASGCLRCRPLAFGVSSGVGR